jgi:hypothetical protein
MTTPLSPDVGRGGRATADAEAGWLGLSLRTKMCRVDVAFAIDVYYRSQEQEHGFEMLYALQIFNSL